MPGNPDDLSGGEGSVRLHWALDVEPGARISGSPAFAANEWLRAVTAFPKLPELLKSLRELKKKVDELERNVERSNPEGPAAAS